MDPPLTAREQKAGYGMETSLFAHQEKVQNASNRRKAYAHSFLGLAKAATEHCQDRVQR
jgi:hypothetical protein